MNILAVSVVVLVLDMLVVVAGMRMAVRLIPVMVLVLMRRLVRVLGQLIPRSMNCTSRLQEGRRGGLGSITVDRPADLSVPSGISVLVHASHGAEESRWMVRTGTSGVERAH